MIKIGNEYIDNYGIVTGFTISDAKRKEMKQEIPGRDGELDYSEALTGFPVFENRIIQISLSIVESDHFTYRKKVNEIKNLLHGVKRDVVFSDDPEFFYSGVWSVAEERKNPLRVDIALTCNAYPYRMKLADTVITKTLTSTLTPIPCRNLRKPVVPIFKTTGQTKIEFEGKSISIGAGTHTLDIVFRAGLNTIKASGTGTLTITYREGGL